MAVIRETNLRVFRIPGGESAPIPIGGGVSSFEANIPLQTTTLESVGRFCQVDMVTGIEPAEASVEFTGIAADDLSSILNFNEPVRLQLFTEVVTETAESARASVVNRTLEVILRFHGDLPLGSREQGELASYDATGQIRLFVITDDGNEVFYFNPFTDEYRVNGQSVIG